MSDEGFLKRWSRLKAAPEQAGVAAEVNFPAPSPELDPVSVSLARPGLTPASDTPSAPPPPTIADAAALTADSDFSTFVAKNVDAAVRRLAMKKLFSDPHFQGHDGLDIYMGDYTIPSPVSADMLAELSHNKNLFARLDEVIEQVDALLGTQDATPDTAAPPPAPDQEVA